MRPPSLLSEIYVGDDLTEREIEMLEAAGRGEEYRDTAARLNLSVETIKHHRKRALAKLGAPNLCRGVVLAIAAGILNIERLVEEEE